MLHHHHHHHPAPPLPSFLLPPSACGVCVGVSRLSCIASPSLFPHLSRFLFSPPPGFCLSPLEWGCDHRPFPCDSAASSALVRFCLCAGVCVSAWVRVFIYVVSGLGFASRHLSLFSCRCTVFHFHPHAVNAPPTTCQHIPCSLPFPSLSLCTAFQRLPLLAPSLKVCFLLTLS